MSRLISEWAIYNVSQNETPSPLASFSDVIERLVDVSTKDMGETVYFEHSERGMVCCTAGQGRATLSYTPQYDKRIQSLVGSRNALSAIGKDKLYHIDSTGSVSSIPSSCLLSVLDVVRGLVYILENHDFPSFLKWSGPAEVC